MLYLFVWLCVIAVLGTSSSIRINNKKDPVIFYGDGPDSNIIYYEQCARRVTCKRNAIYRTVDGTCNNLRNPLWGSSETPYIRLAEAAYDDGNYEVRKQVDGSKLPRPRQLQLETFLPKSKDYLDSNNYHLMQFGQWANHDISLMPPDTTGPERCCSVRIVEINSNSPYQCQLAIEIPTNDPVLKRYNQTCMEFKRAMTAANNFGCPVTPQTPMNQATSFFDASQLYGHKLETANSIRSFDGGKLKTDIINGHEFCPQKKRQGSLLCDDRENVNICFEAGDPRLNQHFGLTAYTTMFTRFHNIVTDKLQEINPEWSDEVLYQEARKFIGALNQIIVYRDYLPILLGKSFTKRVGLDVSKNRRTQYNPAIMPQLTTEFAGGAFRVPHNTLPSTYDYINKNYEVVDSVKFYQWMSKPDPLVLGNNFDQIVRGMTTSPGRLFTPSFNFFISNLMFHTHLTGNEDLLSVDIQRGRDVGVPPYTVVRKLCGFPEVNSFEDLLSIIPYYDVKSLKKQYATVYDIDLLVGALLEPPVGGGTVGQTAQCILADVFYRIRFGDRFFFDVRGQPGSYSLAQLRTLRNIDLGHVLCATTELDEVPMDIFKTSRRTPMMKCKNKLSKLDLSAWRE
ncbi:peroxidase-like isoform X2 [Acyrthosiphon pisum]|nr:peroxidase-like isoform X2 [Acyrthosiphon pisum]XP_008186764.1 peroxidase-like isoform X2 [Acyrthosiphon pisum]XP_016662958.1 peroxidase-like isoform X2 [Acyrthosiphon pisum]|eukprot:XP_003247028.1 PREDICTED: peroxidase-like isoform X2 [Acyrthosiphon pisum]